MTSIGYNGGNFWYRTAERFYTFPERVGQALSIDNKDSNKVSRYLKQEVKQAFNYDYSHFAKMDMGKMKSLLAEPPKGALLFLLYPATVGPRIYAAYQRGKKENDYREIWDIVRRDIPAITLFVYALPIIVRSLGTMTEKLSGVKLVDKKSEQVLSYSQLQNYHIDNRQILRAILNEQSGPGLKSAVDKLHDNGLSKLGFKKVSEALEGLKKSVHELVAEHDAKKAVTEQAAKGTFKHFEKADDAIKATLQEAYEKGSTKALTAAKDLQGEIKGVLKNYAKVRRLPSDMVSFAIIIGLIGWFPVWFNNLWNKRQWEKEQAEKAAHQNAPQPIAPPAATAVGPVAAPQFQQSPFRPSTPAAPMFNYAASAFQGNHNPFNRVI
jgi:hypothetical protein